MWASVLNFVWEMLKRSYLWVFGTAGLIVSVWPSAVTFFKAWAGDIFRYGIDKIGPENLSWVTGEHASFPNIAGTIAGWTTFVNQLFPLAESVAILFGVMAAVGAVRLTRYLLGLVPTLSIS